MEMLLGTKKYPNHYKRAQMFYSNQIIGTNKLAIQPTVPMEMDLPVWAWTRNNGHNYDISSIDDTPRPHLLAVAFCNHIQRSKVG